MSSVSWRLENGYCNKRAIPRKKSPKHVQHLHSTFTSLRHYIIIFIIIYYTYCFHTLSFLFPCCAQPCSPSVEKSCTAIAKNSGIYGTHSSNEGHVRCKIIIGIFCLRLECKLFHSFSVYHVSLIVRVSSYPQQGSSHSVQTRRAVQSSAEQLPSSRGARAWAHRHKSAISRQLWGLFFFFPSSFWFSLLSYFRQVYFIKSGGL